MQNTPRNIEEKPYNACLDCANLGKVCDGPNFLAMSIERWVEWCRMRKMYLGWTAQQLADKSGVALGSIERIFSGRTKDPMLSTVQLITKALVNGSWGQYPCADPGGGSAELAQECAQLKKELLDMTEKKDHFKQLSGERWEQMREKDKLLDERAVFLRMKDEEVSRQKRISRNLFMTLCLAVAVIIIALATDAVIPLF